MKKPKFQYPTHINLQEEVCDQKGDMIPRYGRLKDRETGQERESGELYDVLNPCKPILPTNAKVVTRTRITGAELKVVRSQSLVFTSDAGVNIA